MLPKARVGRRRRFGEGLGVGKVRRHRWGSDILNWDSALGPRLSMEGSVFVGWGRVVGGVGRSVPI